MTSCAQPGCTGKIEDGYCDVCGMAGPHAASPPATTGSARTSTGSARTGSGKMPMTRSSRSTRSTRSTRSGSSRSQRTGSRALGGRPLARPPLPPLDPLAAIVPGVVPERKRFCSACDTPLKRDAGFCPKCGQEYSFVPALGPGSVVADKYEIKGTLAFGGLGWIYLALDTVLTRWVTLKGLLNAKDPRMLEVAVAEREYLAAVKHPNIVGIYDFVHHGDQGYIVMEYVNGKTLMALRKERGGPLPVEEAISYIAEILPAFQYMDEMGLVYCDMKPENVMVEEETVKLIDLGAVRRSDDVGGDVYGSRGYTAPEASASPTPLSDLYSVARALAVLCASFEFQGRYEHSLPPPAEVPVFAEHPSLHRFLVKATRPKPEERFQSASEMAEQLVGVLRAVTRGTHDLGPFESSLFTIEGDRQSDPSSGPASDGMPRPRVDPGDPAAAVVVAAAVLPDAERRQAILLRAEKQHPDSIDLRLALVGEHVTLGRFKEAERIMAEVRAKAPNDWRLGWHEARKLLAQGKKRSARDAFEAVAVELPGELSPLYALGVACEAAGDTDAAIAHYDTVSRADPAFTGASFRLARCWEKKGDRVAAVAAYRRVAPTASRHAAAQMAIARLLVEAPAGEPFAPLDDLVVAGTAIESRDASIEGSAVHLLRAEVYSAAALCVRGTDGLPHDTKILGVDLDEESLRLAAEEAYRAAARKAEADEERWRLVDMANQVRPVTWT